MNKKSLISFEEQIASLFNSGKIRAPVHLYHGNEDKLINIFKKIKKNDWVFCTWRSHYQCLLKGVPKDEVKKEILEGRSISLCFPKHLSGLVFPGLNYTFSSLFPRCPYLTHPLWQELVRRSKQYSVYPLQKIL